MMMLILQDLLKKMKGLWLLDQEDLFLFVPICLGVGIAFYFSLGFEPGIWFLGLIFCVSVISLYLFRQIYPLIWFVRGVVLCMLGLALALIRTIIVEAPVIEHSYKAAKIIAVIDAIEAKPKHKWQLRLRPLSIKGVKKKNYPAFLRLSARQKIAASLFPGQVIKFRAALFRPSRPSIPYGYDFARRAFFQQIGAVGYIVSHITPLKTGVSENGFSKEGFKNTFFQSIERLRQNVTKRVMAVLPNQEGAIAAALLTGKRGAIDQAQYDDIRHSGLAHLLAISGLHMAVMAGTLFWLSHLIFALSTRLSLSWPIRKWAVVVALIGATFYLFLSGAGIATQRAYMMLVVGFMAILLDRPALTLRNLALAACVILVFRPESLLEAGFQMSFATTAALISFYEYRQARLEKNIKNLDQAGFLGQVKRFLGGVFLTSLIAGFAVIPFSAFHFHQIAVYSLIGNLLVMPIFVFLVMPMTLLTLVLMPFGLEAIALKVMALGLSYIIDIAHYVSSWEGAIFSFPVFTNFYLVVMSVGGIILVLLKSNIRFLGILPFLMGLYGGVHYQEFDVLIDAKLEAVAFGVQSGKQRKTNQHSYQLLALKRKKSRLEQWLKFSNRAFSKSSKAAVVGGRFKNIKCDITACIFKVRTKKIAVIMHRSALAEECQKSDILILNFPLRKKVMSCPVPEKVITRTQLRKQGAYGLWIRSGQIDIKMVTAITGLRPWSYKVKSYKFKNGG